jgi:hypothetical protein
VCFDGTDVWVLSRAARALCTQRNSVDIGTRSVSLFDVVTELRQGVAR